MAKLNGAVLHDVVKIFESIVPLRLAESWDNVGLLVEPSSPHLVQKLMLTNDLTKPVLNEAVQSNCNMIYSYHPPIFKSFKRLTQHDIKQQMIIQCIENRIAVFSPHTSHDVADGGVNDWLLAAFGTVTNKSPVSKSEDVVRAEKILISEGERLHLKENLGVDIQPTFGQFCYLSHSTAAYLKPEAVAEIGCGRKASLKSPLTVSQAIDLVKSYLKLPYLRVAVGEGKTLDDEVKTVACCAGSGSSVLNDCDVDLYLTGEMSHHDVLHATSHGRSVILCEHSNTERGYLSFLQETISSLLPTVECSVSVTDKDPLVIM